MDCTRIRFLMQRGLILSVLVIAGSAAAADGRTPPANECPQPRFTGKAPQDIYALSNPLSVNAETLAAGERLYLGKAGSVSCATCHGANGDGKGKLASQFDPAPRNFACAQTVNGIPDGQLFWIIRNGSPGTAMSPANAIGKFSDQDIWQIVAHIRRLAR
jgi:mono/diheme cytochrome c family protein